MNHGNGSTWTNRVVWNSSVNYRIQLGEIPKIFCFSWLGNLFSLFLSVYMPFKRHGWLFFFFGLCEYQPKSRCYLFIWWSEGPLQKRMSFVHFGMSILMASNAILVFNCFSIVRPIGPQQPTCPTFLKKGREYELSIRGRGRVIQSIRATCLNWM